MKTDFINNMTHEFKTPISTISISVDALESPTIAEKPDKLKRYVKIIRLENQRLQEQVERILQAATIEKEKVEIKKHPIDIHEILKKVEKTFKINTESKNGTLQCDLKAANPIIMGDEAHLMNIFNNLIDNAIKYSPENLDISISTRNVNDEIEISISDKGLGISSEHQPFVFDKFYRVPTGNVHDVKGFGIGLNYVNLLVQRHNGKIILRSKKGEGSTFILTFKILKL
jgi:two-component system phosphate regulon sensor histidine kinase PhoR